jgi:hypothetical protein
VRRHDLDWTSLVAGVVITAIAAAYLGGAWTDLRIDGRWVLPLGLVGIGLAGLAGGLSAVRRDRRAEEPQLATDHEADLS